MRRGRKRGGMLAAVALATGIVSTADAATRCGILQGVVFDDGATATGACPAGGLRVWIREGRGPDATITCAMGAP